MAKRLRIKAGKNILLWCVMLFQLTAMLLLTLRTDPIDLQSLVLAFVMPALTFAVVRGLPVFFPIDTTLLTLVLFLCSVSVVTLTAIARAAVTPLTQGAYILAGLAGMIAGIVFMRHFRRGRFWMVPLMVFSVGFTALPLLIGETKYGATNWISILGDTVSLQPSEFVKLSLCLTLAVCLSERQSRFMRAAVIVFGASLCAVLLIERDLGALLLYFLTTVAVYFVATSNGLLSLAGLGAGAAGAVGAYYAFPYVQKRIAVWKNPWSDPADSGYQLIQSLIAIGSGGLFGMGLGLGMPRSIPLYHSDFVFAAICEQFGLVFALCLLGVYALIIMKGVSIAMNCSNGFHALVCFGVILIMAIQTLLIVGGNIRLIPLTGVTLPFIAAGGSSMVSSLTGVGMVLGVSSVNREKNFSDDRRAFRRRAGRSR